MDRLDIGPAATEVHEVLYQLAVHHLAALAAALADGRHRLPWARWRIDIRDMRRNVRLLLGIAVDREAMIAFAIQLDIQRARLIKPDSERLEEDEVANLNGPVFEPMGKRRTSELQVACAWDDRLPTPDDMLT